MDTGDSNLVLEEINELKQRIKELEANIKESDEWFEGQIELVRILTQKNNKLKEAIEEIIKYAKIIKLGTNTSKTSAIYLEAEQIELTAQKALKGE